MSDKNILIVLLGTIAIILVILLASWYVGHTHYSPEAREKAFQSELAECDRLAELNGNDWRIKMALDDTCISVFEEYRQRLEIEDKRQAIDEAENQSINDSVAPEPLDIE